MASKFIIWCEEDRDVVRVGGKPLVFDASGDATTYIGKSSNLREDVTNPPSRSPRTYDIVTITVR